MKTYHYLEKRVSETRQRFIGLLLTGAIAVAAILLGKIAVIAAMGFGTLTLAIIIGILLGNTVYPLMAKPCHEGVQFAKQRLLRLGIILYGFNLTFQQVLSVGLSAIAIDAIIVTTTFLLAYWLGRKILGIDAQTTLLIGSGASICGAAAVMAAEPIVKADSSKIAVAVSTVVIFGTLAMFLYPWLYQLNLAYHFIDISPSQFGIYLGSSVHEVAQVVAAGRAISDDASNAAVITKMIRVMMLAPFLLILSSYIGRMIGTDPEQQGTSAIVIPWFAVLFIVVAGFNSLHLLPAAWVNAIQLIDTLFLTMAMAALGLTTHINAVREAGSKPLLLAALLFVWLIVGGLFINLAVHYFLG
jgi:uncharacterized integral membrane protein (TIGR00698 family)